MFIYITLGNFFQIKCLQKQVKILSFTLKTNDFTYGNIYTITTLPSFAY
jgi:hypothetical protein